MTHFISKSATSLMDAVADVMVMVLLLRAPEVHRGGMMVQWILIPTKGRGQGSSLSAAGY